MSQRLLLASAALLGGLIFLAPSWADEPKPLRPDLEKRLDALQKEIEALRKELNAKPTPAPAKTDLRIFKLKSVVATDMAKSLQAIFSGTNRTIRIVADLQTNSLLVSATDEEAAAIQALIQQLDVAVEKKKPEETAPAKADFRIFALKNANAKEMARTLKALVGEKDNTIRIVADEPTNSVIVLGSAADLTTIEAVLTRLDVAVDNDVKNTIRIYPLKDLNAVPTAKVLREIFSTELHKTLRISVSEQTNSLVVSGSVNELMEIESLILRLETVAREKKAEKPGEKR